MPRFKHYNQGQTVLLPVSFERQILPGTFEYTLNYLVDDKRGQIYLWPIIFESPTQARVAADYQNDSLTKKRK